MVFVFVQSLKLYCWSADNECPECSPLHLTDSVIAFPPLHLSSSARPVMLTELAEEDAESAGHQGGGSRDSGVSVSM